MILVDANVLLYAYDPSTPQHDVARRWLEEVLSKPEPVLLPWNCLLAFLRLATNPRVWQQPLSVPEAVAIVDEWLALPNVTVPSPGERHWSILRGLLPEAQCRGPLVMDAHLAALAIEHGATLCTNDRDFSRFPQLRLFNPLE
jgi:toxin-antitoxin system PIN domain toxin